MLFQSDYDYTIWFFKLSKNIQNLNRITGAMGKGLAALTFDDDYQKKRRQDLNKKPTNLSEGLARGGKGLVMVRIQLFLKV